MDKRMKSTTDINDGNTHSFLTQIASSGEGLKVCGVIAHSGSHIVHCLNDDDTLGEYLINVSSLEIFINQGLCQIDSSGVLTLRDRQWAIGFKGKTGSITHLYPTKDKQSAIALFNSRREMNWRFNLGNTPYRLFETCVRWMVLDYQDGSRLGLFDTWKQATQYGESVSSDTMIHPVLTPINFDDGGVDLRSL